MKLKFDKKIVLLITALTIGIGFSSNMVSAYTEPGSTSDPLVTLSYVDMKLTQLKEEIRKEFSESTSQTSPVASNQTTVESANTLFQVIEIKAFDKVILGESTEFILRAGEAITIEGPGGGLADLTTGIDLKDKEIVPLNHHGLSSRNDGRGISALSDGWILIKGKYNLIKK